MICSSVNWLLCFGSEYLDAERGQYTEPIHTLKPVSSSLRLTHCRLHACSRSAHQRVAT